MHSSKASIFRGVHLKEYESMKLNEQSKFSLFFETPEGEFVLICARCMNFMLQSG